MINKTGNLK